MRFAGIKEIVVHNTCVYRQEERFDIEDHWKVDKKIVKRRDLENIASIATMARYLYFPFRNK
jgi:hypothetical protein